MPAIPTAMRALVLESSGPSVADRPVPAPARGQVLVRMHAAPINPNDLMFLAGNYEVKKPRPVVPGFEGSGTVIAAGGGLLARYLVGRRVACMAGDGDGTWAPYLCTAAVNCAPLAADVTLDQGAMLLTNPLTATVLLGEVRRAGGRALVQNAAAGALGRMLVRLCARAGIPLVNIVRRDEQAALLRSLGAEHVLVSTSPAHGDELRELCKRLAIRHGLDAIAGDATGAMLGALCDGGTVTVYGRLSGQSCQIDVDELVFRRKQLRGFTMYEWADRTSMLGKLRAVRRAQRRLGDDLQSEIRTKLPIDAYAEALARASERASEGKILFDLTAS